MNRAAILLPLVLAGCATADGMRGGTPFFTGRTLKPVVSVAGCVATAWGQAGLNLRTEALPERTSVILAGSTMTGSDMIADIYADGQVTMARRNAAWSGLDVKLRDQLQACL